MKNTTFVTDDDYQPTQKSPSMQLAQELGASSHKVQIMKATFFQDEQSDFNMGKTFLCAAHAVTLVFCF